MAKGKVKTKKLSKHTIEELMGDWFEREPGTFVKVHADYSIDWSDDDETLVRIHGEHWGWDLINEVYNMCQSLLYAMNFENSFTLRFHKTRSCTDGRNIHVATEVLDETTKPLLERTNIVLGLAAHEGCHVLYTNFKYANERELERSKTYSPAARKIIHKIANILEDERIEQQLGLDMPGYVRYLVPLKKFYFEECYERELEKLRESKRSSGGIGVVRKLAEESGLVEEEIPELNPFERLMDLFLRIVRYPTNLDKEDFIFFGKYLLDLRELLTPYPETSEEVEDTAEKIFELFKTFYKEPPAPPKEKDGALRIVLATLGEPLSGDIEKDAEKLITILVDVFDGAYEGDTSSEEARILLLDPFKLKVLEGDAFEGSTSDIRVHKGTDDETSYQRARELIQEFIPGLRNALTLHNQQFVRTLYAMRSGQLDDSRIADAVMGSQNVHLQFQTVRTDSVVIGLLLDQSGSMGGAPMMYAQAVAILLKEALEKVFNIELFIYGHTADLHGKSTDLFVYREPKHMPRYALGSAYAISQNRDGKAILETGKRIRKFSQKPGVLFVISDGAPCATDYGGRAAIADTKECVDKVHRMGLEVVQVAIDSSVPSEQMFRHYVKFTDLATLGKQMTQLVKGLAMSKAQVHVE